MLQVHDHNQNTTPIYPVTGMQSIHRKLQNPKIHWLVF